MTEEYKASYYNPYLELGFSSKQEFENHIKFLIATGKWIPPKGWAEDSQSDIPAES